MKVKKIDKRMNGYGDFARFVDFYNFEKFIEVRNWCWETWGPSCELEIWKKYHNKNPAWAWMFDEYRTRIYFASDSEAQWYYLRWGK